MPDFKTWSPENLARFCEESQAEIISLNNRYADVVRILSALTDDYASLADQFCCKPERNPTYRAAKELLK